MLRIKSRSQGCGNVLDPTTNKLCNKKLEVDGDGRLGCARCGCVVEQYHWRALLRVCIENAPQHSTFQSFQMEITDFSGSQWVTGFKEAFEVIVGMKVADLGLLHEDGEVWFDFVKRYIHSCAE